MKLTYDLETTSLDVHSCKILGIAICIAVGIAYYIVLPKEKKKQRLILDRLRPYFEDESIDKVGHNLKFDNKVLKQYGIDVKGRLHDTMVADYVLHPETKKHGLKILSKLYFNYQQIPFDHVAVGKKDKTLEGVDPAIVKDYACEDADQTLQLHNFLLPKINDNKLSNVYDMDCQLVPVLTEMEWNGVTIDIDKLGQIEKGINQQLEELSIQIDKITGGDVNLNSSKQLNILLFDNLGLEPTGTKGKNGCYSVSKANLQMMESLHPIVKLILDYKALNKVITTFIPALKRLNPITGKLHTSINQTVTATGRLSSSNPNLQNIPSRTIGSKLRESFIASSPDHTLIGADYSNIEMRVMAIISHDPKMIYAYKNGIDLHILTASKVLGIPYEQVEKSQRNMAKTINFGLIYGMTARGLSQALTQNTGTEFSVEQCQQFIHNYFELYEGVAKCRDDLIYQATINGYAETLFGRKRVLPDINSSDSFKRESAKRLAMNTPIQGTAADIIKMAMINIHNRIQKEKLQSKMILQVHDELLFDVPNKELKYMETLIADEMINVAHFSIALEIDLKTGKNWAEVN